MFLWLHNWHLQKIILQPVKLLLLLLLPRAVVACSAELGPLLLRVCFFYTSKCNQCSTFTVLVLISSCTLISGMAFGTGSAVAHRAVDAVMGPRTIQHETVVSEAASSMTPAGTTVGSDSCDNPSKAFQDVCSHPHLLQTPIWWQRFVPIFTCPACDTQLFSLVQTCFLLFH